jgi:hypothetical protein
MYLNKKNYTGINNTDFYNFFLFGYFVLYIGYFICWIF